MNSLTTKTFIPRKTQIYGPGEVKKEEEKKQPADAANQQARPNTNIMALDFAVLEKAENVATGDPTRCAKCMSFLNKFSHYDRPTKTWVCEFCEFPNILSIIDEELPKTDIISYVDSEQEDNKMNAALAQSGNNIVFCIDISGSMSSQKLYTGPTNKYLKNPTQISRLECLKIAIDDQLKKMLQTSPDAKVGFVLFGSEVTIMGDSSRGDIVLQADADTYMEIFREAANNAQNCLNQPLKDIYPTLINQLERMDCNGSTALGPGLLTAVSLLCSKGGVGSKVILCTDGQANVGIGQVDHVHSYDASNAYNRIGDLALENGLVISLVSIVEEECRLDLLAPCATKTGGNIVKLDPTKLSSGIAEFITEKVLGFDVMVAIKLHNSLKFMSISPKDLGPDPTVMVKKLGNVGATTQFTFEYTVKSQQECERENINIDRIKKAPFQALINYISADGIRYIKVISKEQEITRNQQEAEQNLNVDILSAHSAAKTANLAMIGQMDQAVATTNIYRNLVRGKKDEEDKYDNTVRQIENVVQQEARTKQYQRGIVTDKLISSCSVTKKLYPKRNAEEAQHRLQQQQQQQQLQPQPPQQQQNRINNP
jgi:hypothetical protein